MVTYQPCRKCIHWKRRDDEKGQCWHDPAMAPETHEHHTCPSWAQKVIHVEAAAVPARTV
jgi:hypothetical protein